MSVADMTASVMSRRGVDGAAVGTTASAVLFIATAGSVARRRVAGDEDAAGDQVQQGLLRRIRPPARKAPPCAMTYDDEVHAQSLRGRGNLLERIADHELALYGQSMSL